MNKGKPEEGDRKDISIRGKEGARSGGGIPSSLSLPGHEVRSQDRREKELAGIQVLEQLAGWATGLGASDKVNMSVAGPPSWLEGEETFSVQPRGSRAKSKHDKSQSHLRTHHLTLTPHHFDRPKPGCSLNSPLVPAQRGTRVCPGGWVDRHMLQARVAGAVFPP